MKISKFLNFRDRTQIMQDHLSILDTERIAKYHPSAQSTITDNLDTTKFMNHPSLKIESEVEINCNRLCMNKTYQTDHSNQFVTVALLHFDSLMDF